MTAQQEQPWLARWRGGCHRSQGLVQPSAVGALGAMLCSGAPTPVEGEPLPPLWHLAALPTWLPLTALGTDGHPFKGGLLPPVPLPRRMFAGGSLALDGPLLVGSRVVVEQEVVDVEPKTGRSGELVVVTVEQRILAPDAESAAWVERQQLVYREAGSPAAAPQRGASPVGFDGMRRLSAWHWHLRTDPVLLFRFSAATANSHRIHYDAQYATAVEGYPALVVQGPLLAIALAEVVRGETELALSAFRFRAHAPSFCGEELCLRGETRPEDRSTILLRASLCGQDEPRMTAEAVLA